jgi:hypothetical protein
MKNVLVACLLGLLLSTALGKDVFAQERCANTALMQTLSPELRRYYPGGDIFEAQLRSARLSMSLCDSGTIFRIPVVFHIIHNGEAIGIGSNIADARLTEQIRMLNEDFGRKAGTPGYNTDPRGQDAMIEFYLACQDPQGRASTGIIRTQGALTSWGLGDNDVLKNTSLWPTNQYLNIWVCNLTNGYLGYSSFPSTTLPYGGGTVFSRPDGVVLAYKCVGSSVSRYYNLGRTATHEIGHFFGLIHIWGDGDCSASDYCDDTPPQAGALNRCPFIPVDTSDMHCPGQPAIMYRNYMGYVYDSCMNIFTHDQVARMRYVLCNTPARDSLKTLQGCYTSTKPIQSELFIVKNNPSLSNNFTLQFNDSGPTTITIYTVDGRLLGQWGFVAKAGQDYTLDLSLYGAGLYAAMITQNNRQTIVRLMAGGVSK